MLAAFKIRAVPVNVNYRYVEEELRYLFNDADAKAVLFHREFAPKLAAIRELVPLLTTFVSVEDGTDEDVSALDATAYADALAASSDIRDFPGRSADDLYVLYTGGTTGMPKGVMWRHEDIFFGAFGGGDFAGQGDREAGGDRGAGGRRSHPLPACVPVHARHRALDGVHCAVRRWDRRHLRGPALRPDPALGARVAREGQLPGHRG